MNRVAQEELVAAQASKAKLCEEIGMLKQTKQHQSKQLDKYKIDLQTAREAKAVMTKKVEQLETSTWTIKQQYIRYVRLGLVQEPAQLLAREFDYDLCPVDRLHLVSRQVLKFFSS